jgi:hypothetical protein
MYRRSIGWLDTQPKPFVVAEVPVPSQGDLGALERQQTQSMLHATAHWQRTVHGYSGIRRPLHDQLYLDMSSFPDAGSINSLAKSACGTSSSTQRICGSLAGS